MAVLPDHENENCCGLQQGDPAETLRTLFTIRDPLYREIADHIIETDGCSPRTVAQRLVRQLGS